MKAIVVTDQSAGTSGMRLADQPEPQPGVGDVVVEVHASGFTHDELTWPGTWVDRFGRDRTPVIPGQEVAGVVSALGYGTRGLQVGQRVFGLADGYRTGTLAEYIAIDARNVAPLSIDIDFTDAASLAMPGLTAWQGLFEHGRLQAGQTVFVPGAAGAVGSVVVQLARAAGARVIGGGRAAHRETVLAFGANEFVDLAGDELAALAGVNLVFDIFGGEIGKVAAQSLVPGGTLVSIAGPPETRPEDVTAVDFVVVPDRGQLTQIARYFEDGRLRSHIGQIVSLDDAAAALSADGRPSGKTIVRVRP